jgi:hypothetical protein
MAFDTLKQLKFADDILKSGQGTPEERAAIQMQMQEALPAIEFATEWAGTGSFRSGDFFNMSEGNQNIVNEFMRNESRKQTAQANSKMLQFAGGMGRGATEVGVMAADMLGFIPGADWVSEKMGTQGERITEATTDLSRSILEKGFGRRLSEEEARDHEVNVESAMQKGEVVEKVALAVAGPSRIIGMAKGFWSGLGLGAAEGALTGALVADIDQDMTEEERAEQRLSGATIGTVFGGGMGAITGAFASVRNLIAGKIASTRSQADEAFALADEFDVPITLGQATGSPTVQAAEQAAASDAAQRFLAQQANRLGPAVATKLKVALPRLANIGEELPARIKDSFGILDDVIADVKAVRQGAWRVAGKKAVELGGDTPIMDVRKIQGQMQNIVEQIDSRFGGAAEMGVNFRRLQEEVGRAAARGGATAEQVSEWWLRINTMAGAPSTSGFVNAVDKASDIAGPQLDALSGMLQRTMKQSIDAATDSPAMAILKAQRNAWSDGTRTIQMLNENILEKIGLTGKVTGQSLLKSLDSIPLSNLREATRFIRKQPGGALKLREIQGSILESAVEAGMRSKLPTPAQSGLLDVKAFADSLGDITTRSRLAGFLTEAQEVTARKAIELTRTTLNEGAQQSNRVMHRIVAGAENIAINLVSRDPGFMARLLAGALARGRGADWLFYSREGVDILRTIHPQYLQFGKTAQARQAATVLLTSMLADGAKEATEEELNARQQ